MLKIIGRGRQFGKINQKIYKLAGIEFNIASPLQLREVLFDKLGISLEGIKKAKPVCPLRPKNWKNAHLHPVIDEISIIANNQTAKYIYRCSANLD